MRTKEMSNEELLAALTAALREERDVSDRVEELLNELGASEAETAEGETDAEGDEVIELEVSADLFEMLERAKSLMGDRSVDHTLVLQRALDALLRLS